MQGMAKADAICHLQSEGVLGLYRGFGMSIATFVPTSGIWWGAYGAYQKLIWQQVLTSSTASLACEPSDAHRQGLACCVFQATEAAHPHLSLRHISVGFRVGVSI